METVLTADFSSFFWVSNNNNTRKHWIECSEHWIESEEDKKKEEKKENLSRHRCL